MAKLHELVSLSPPAVKAAYPRVRAALARDPLFMKDRERFEVSLGELDARLKRAPSKTADLLEWLDGPDQYRYAGLKVLHAAFGGAPAQVIAADHTFASGRTTVIAGDLQIRGNVSVEDGAALFVLGNLTIDGCLIGGTDFSVVAAASMRFSSGCTGGELIALSTIRGGERVYLHGNDHSCRARALHAGTLIDFERGNVFTRVTVRHRVSRSSFPAAARALGLPGGTDDLVGAFEDALRGIPGPPTELAHQIDLDELARTSPKELAGALGDRIWSAAALSTALGFAAKWDQPRCVKLLLDHGARDPNGNALVAALGAPATLKLLLDVEGSPGPDAVVNGSPLLHLAVTQSDEAGIRLLVQRKVDMNARGSCGQNALHACAHHGKVALAKILLAAGCDQSVKLERPWHDFGHTGETALDIATRQAKVQSHSAWPALVKLLR